MANYSVCTRCYPLLLLVLLLLLLQQHLLLYCLLYSGLFLQLLSLQLRTSVWRMRLNQRILIIIFNYRKWFCVCFNLHSTLAILVVSLFSLLFSVSLCFKCFFIQQGVCFSAGIPICSTAGNQGAFSIAAYGFALIKFQAQICRDSPPPLSFPLRGSAEIRFAAKRSADCRERPKLRRNIEWSVQLKLLAGNRQK